MSKAVVPKLAILGDSRKGLVAGAIGDFLDFIKGKADIAVRCGIDDFTSDMLEGVDYAVVFGGDGSIISAARQLSRSDVPVIGVNLGKLGFLAEFSVAELKDFFSHINSDEVTIERRMTVLCTVSHEGGKKFSSVAINDVFITAGQPFRMIELAISVNGQPVGGCVGDGVVIATPTGSTAYNLSAGGPILSQRMEAMVVTAICPHSLSFRPIVIDSLSRVEVSGVRVNEGTMISIDGQISLGMSAGDVVSIERGENDFLVVNNPLRTNWDTLATKLGWAEKPKYKDIL